MSTNVDSLNMIKTKENLVFSKTPVLLDNIMHYCPGCAHSVTHRILAEVIDAMDIQDKTVGVCPVGCAVLAYNYIDIDWQESAHGRAPALATAIKRLYHDKFVFTYQGDGDLAAIGTNETIHACNRGENIVIIFINNAIYGMTGGQMAPTTLLGQRTSTSPYGREFSLAGAPIKISNLVAQLSGTYFVSRHSVHTAPNVRKAKKAIRRAFEFQQEKKGTSLVEIVANCPSGWKMTPIQANQWLEENMLKEYPLGDIKIEGKLV